MSYKMARRSFLRGCGGSAALLLPLLRSIEARAQGMAAPLRLLVLHHPLGAAPGLGTWRPAATATTTTFTLPAESAPFTPLKSKMVMIDGLNLITASKAPGNSGGQNTHEGGMVALMTGVPALGQIGQQDHCAGGPSIEQLLLARSPTLGGAGSPANKQTMFGSLQLAADIRSDRDEIAPRVLSYMPPTSNPDISLARQPLYAETEPLTTFTRIFGGAMPTGTNTAALLANRLSILDFMRSDLARMQSLVPASEKPKLDVHATAIQQLESSIRTTLGPADTGSTCTKPAAPAYFTQSGMGASTSSGLAPAGGSKLSGVDYYLSNDPTNHPHQALGQAHLSLIRAAFACDLVRTSTFMWSSGTNWVVFPGTFNGATIKGNLQSTPHHPPSHSDPTGDTMTRDWLNQINLFYSQQTATALQAFDSTTDIDGNTLLDNTIVVYVTEVARAWDHNQMGVPLLVFGGKNTRLKGGTFVKVTNGSLPMQTGVGTSGGTGNRPFNDFWLALAPVFGVTLTSLGNSNQFTGPLSGVFA